MGILPLTNNATTHSRSYAFPNSYYMLPTGTWPGLSGGVGVPSSEEYGWAQLTALGPYSIAPLSDVVDGFAMIYGSILDDLRVNARRAKEMYDAWALPPRPPDPPGAPTLVSGDGSMNVSWMAPEENGWLSRIMMCVTARARGLVLPGLHGTLPLQLCQQRLPV